MVTVRKPAARRTAPAKPRAAAAPVKREAAKPAPVARKAAAAPVPEKRGAAGRVARSAKAAEVKETAVKGVEVHPTRKAEISANDVARAWHTALMLQLQFARQQGEEMSEVLDFVAPIMGNPVGTPKKSPQTRAKVAPEDRVIGEYYNRDTVEKYSLKELRELATDLVENGVITEKVKKVTILAQMEAAGLFREDGSADADEDDIEDDVDEDAEEDDVEDEEEESDDDDDEDDTEDVVYDRADLKKMTLKDLQELAEANEYNWEGLGKTELIDALLADDEDEEEAEEEDEEDDDDVVGIDPDELPNMPLDELLDLCKQIELKVPVAKRKNKKAVIQMILDELGEEDDE